MCLDLMLRILAKSIIWEATLRNETWGRLPKAAKADTFLEGKIVELHVILQLLKWWHMIILVKF